MKAVAFNGSPRANGNTRILLEKVLEPIAQAGIETEIVEIGQNPVKGCIACYACAKNQNKLCAVKDDPLNDYLAKALEADAIIIGSPVYFADLSAQAKAFIDRAGFVAKANGNLFSRKIGAAVIAQRRGGATNVLDSINKLFLISGMIVPGSTYWNFGVGRDKGEVLNDAEGMGNMANLGDNIAWLLKKLHG